MKNQSYNTHCSKVNSKVKVSDKPNDKMIDRQDKNNMLPDLASKGHKNSQLIHTRIHEEHCHEIRHTHTKRRF